VVGASDGYPGRYLKGKAIELPDDAGDDRWIIHAGTAIHDDHLVTAGGRVLGAVGLGDTPAAARNAAYELLDRVHFEGLTYRRDIAGRGGVGHG
jgi:phosphoribosylamine-glycine ligase